MVYVGWPWSGSGAIFQIGNSMFFLNDSSSALRNINCGVPQLQGSISGSLLFVVYINDCCRSSDILPSVFLADDTN